ncbi:MAG TPA: tetratricopeptide repeat protein [Bacteroidales bacterium]|nr:tetratricopeptide repeat protein [Bacteroidales bacterium]
MPLFRRKSCTSIPVILLTMLMIAGCKTDKDAWINRNYHSLTTHYNGYFNGNESLKEGVEQIRQNHKDDYTRILPVFQYGDQTTASGANSYMDVAIKKASIRISKSTMFIRGQEKNRWIDDCWMLIGKAHFYKMEYEQAIQNFDFVIARYKNLPTRYEAMLWKIRANSQMKRFGDNEALLGLVQNSIEERQAPPAVKRMFPLVKADHFLQSGNPDGAIGPLKEAVKLTWNKKAKVRSMFILAQIYQKKGMYDEAATFYNRVIDKNPPYEMAFNAKINMARCYSAGSGGSKSIKKYLNKMMKDEKNKEYLDQVYFAMAEVYMKEKNDSLAMKNLRLSVASSLNNPNQKALSSLLLADLHFQHENYQDAQAYYDSAVTYLQKDYPEYEALMTKHKILTKLVANLLVVQTQDSLLRLSAMTPAERTRIVNGIISEITRKEQEAKAEEASGRQNVGFLEMENRNLNQMQKTTSEWYFDNPTTRSFGFTEFRSKWGERKLEDLWRISSKTGDASLLTPEELLADSLRKDSLKNVAANLKNPDFYLKNIPTTPEAIEAAHLKVEKALYNMGYIYYHDLEDLDKSAETFEQQIKRYAKGEWVPPALYQLSLVYADWGFADKAAQFRNRLVTEHPEHEYAKIVSDPDYFKNKAIASSAHKAYYTDTWNLFQEGKLAAAKARCDSAMANTQFVEGHPKFSLLKAMIIGKTEGKAPYQQALEHTATKYAKFPEGVYAGDLLKLLTAEVEKDTVQTAPADTKIDYSIYAFSAGKPHMVLIIIDTKYGKTDRVKNKISDFNRKSFSLKNLNTTSTILQAPLEMITVTGFSDAKDAKIYYDALISGNVVTGKDAEGSFHIFAISTDNYPIFFKDKDLAKYQAFFKDHYLK